MAKNDVITMKCRSATVWRLTAIPMIFALSGCLATVKDAADIGATDLERPVSSYTTFVAPGSLGGANASNTNTTIVMETDTRRMTAVFAQEAYEMDLKDGQRVNKKAMEIMSHEIEVVVAVDRYLEEEEAYRIAEAGRMKTGYNYFDGMPVERLTKLMERKHRKAVKWVNKHNDVLDDFERFRKRSGVEDRRRDEAIENGARP